MSEILELTPPPFVEVGLFGKFLIHYWDDFLAKQLRIVRIAQRE